VTIVVVEDEPHRRCVPELQPKGHRVHDFTRADEALRHLSIAT
jgi:hypothetical protein